MTSAAGAASTAAGYACAAAGRGASLGHIALCKASVLYLGSAVPLETAVGVESIQLPCRERFSAAVGADQKVSGIDSVLTVYSSGLLLQYTGDQNNTTWFPMQALHVSAAVTPVANCGLGQPRFVPLDQPGSLDCSGSQPPIFCCITRRTKGIKVLECHVFICKSVEGAMALVQATSYAYEHREGWLPEQALPPGPCAVDTLMFGGAGGSRIIPAQNGGCGGGQNGCSSSLIQKFSLLSTDSQLKPSQQPAPAVPPPAAPPQSAPAPAPQAAAPAQPAPTAATTAPIIQIVPFPVPVGNQQVPMPVRNQYFSNWDAFAGQSVMFIPGSPFYPGDQFMSEQKKKCRKSKERKKKKKDSKKKSKKSDSDSDEETELYYIRKHQETKQSGQNQTHQPNDYIVFAPKQQCIVQQQEPTTAGNGQDYSYYRGIGDSGPQPPVDYYGPDYGPDYGYDVQMQYGPEYGIDYGLGPTYGVDYIPADEEYRAAAQYEADRRAAEEYAAMLDYNRAVAATGVDAGPYGDPYGYYTGPGPIRGYNDLVDGLGYYP